MLYFNLPGCRSHPGHRLAGAANWARLFYWGQKILKKTNQKYITTFLNWQIAQFRACVDKHKGRSLTRARLSANVDQALSLIGLY